MVLKIPSARLPAVENSRSKKISINKAERKIKYLWKYSGFSCYNKSHQSKDIVNCQYFELFWRRVIKSC